MCEKKSYYELSPTTPYNEPCKSRSDMSTCWLGLVQTLSDHQYGDRKTVRPIPSSTGPHSGRSPTREPSLKLAKLARA